MKEKLAYSVEDAAEISDCGRTAVYEAIRTGGLVARKLGRRTLILRADLQDWLERLPRMSRPANDNLPTPREEASAPSNPHLPSSRKPSQGKRVRGKDG